MASKFYYWLSTDQPDVSPRRSRWVAMFLGAVLLLALLLNLRAALMRLFWFDEVTTLATVQSPAGIWNSLLAGFDSSAPLFPLLERWFGSLPVHEHIGYRLLSMLAAAGISTALFAAFRARLGNLGGLVAASFPLLTTLHSLYAIEARAYELFTCMAALAWLSWQRAPRLAWILSLGISLAAAVSVHYLAVLIFLPLGVGELVRWLRTKQFRVLVWGALLAGGTPLLVFRPIMAGLSQKYSSNYWSKPDLIRLPAHYDTLVGLGDGVGSGLAVAIGVGLLVLLWKQWKDAAPGSVPVEELAVSLTFLCLPFAAYLLMKIMNGGLTARYALPMLIGMAGGAAQLTHWLGRKTAALALVWMLSIFGLREARNLAQTIRQPLTPPTSALPVDVLEAARSAGLPLVIASAQEYLTLAYYGRPSPPFLILVDPPAAIHYAGTDSLDLNLTMIRGYFPVNVQLYAEFQQKNPRFLLYSQSDDPWNWWPQRLTQEGRVLQPLILQQNHVLYLVN